MNNATKKKLVPKKSNQKNIITFAKNARKIVGAILLTGCNGSTLNMYLIHPLGYYIQRIYSISHLITRSSSSNYLCLNRLHHPLFPC